MPENGCQNCTGSSTPRAFTRLSRATTPTCWFNFQANDADSSSGRPRVMQCTIASFSGVPTPLADIPIPDGLAVVIVIPLRI